MASFYSVVQYVPDMIRNERINIGVIAWSGRDKTEIFLQNWSRVRHMGGRAEAIKDSCEELKRMDVDHVLLALKRWENGIQLTEPSASLLDVHTLLLDAANRYLVDSEITERAYTTKVELVRHARTAIKGSLSRLVNRAAAQLIESEPREIEGRLAVHAFDIAATNGEPIFAANAISFEVPRQKSLRQQVDASAWAIEDTRKRVESIPLAVIASRPLPENSQLYQEASEVFRQLGAEVIAEESIPDWSDRMAQAVREHLPEYLQGSPRGPGG